MDIIDLTLDDDDDGIRSISSIENYEENRKIDETGIHDEVHMYCITMYFTLPIICIWLYLPIYFYDVLNSIRGSLKKEYSQCN